MNLPNINYETIQLATQGNQEAMDIIYQEVYPSTYKYLVDTFHMGSIQAKQISSECIREALQNLKTDTSFEAYLQAIIDSKMQNVEIISESKIPPVPPRVPEEEIDENHTQIKTNIGKNAQYVFWIVFIMIFVITFLICF